MEWLGFEVSKEGIATVNGNVQGITERVKPNHLRILGSFLGVVSQLNEVFPELANFCAPFRSILSRESE